MPQTLVELKHIYYRYQPQSPWVFQDLNLKLNSHQKTAILGHNGSGKSTLFFIIAGLYPLNQGTLLWQEIPLKNDPHALKQWRQRIGLAFQNPEHQLVAGTVSEDISYGLCNQNLSSPEIHHRVTQIITDFHLETIAHTPLHHLSLGQKRRVALAGVMVLEPQLLLLDEPTAYLDSQQLQTLHQELTKIHHQGTTITIATHDVDFAYQWADWFIILHQGKLILEGSAETIFSQPEILHSLSLKPPTLWVAWYSLPLTCRPPETPVPRSLEAWKTIFAR